MYPNIKDFTLYKDKSTANIGSNRQIPLDIMQFRPNHTLNKEKLAQMQAIKAYQRLIKRFVRFFNL